MAIEPSSSYLVLFEALDRSTTTTTTTHFTPSIRNVRWFVGPLSCAVKCSNLLTLQLPRLSRVISPQPPFNRRTFSGQLFSRINNLITLLRGGSGLWKIQALMSNPLSRKRLSPITAGLNSLFALASECLHFLKFETILRSLPPFVLILLIDTAMMRDPLVRFSLCLFSDQISDNSTSRRRPVTAS